LRARDIARSRQRSSIIWTW